MFRVLEVFKPFLLLALRWKLVYKRPNFWGPWFFWTNICRTKILFDQTFFILYINLSKKKENWERFPYKLTLLTSIRSKTKKLKLAKNKFEGVRRFGELTSFLEAKFFKGCPLSSKAVALEILQGYSFWWLTWLTWLTW